MGLFDSLKKNVQSQMNQAIRSSVKRGVNELSHGVQQAAHRAINSKSQKFTFSSLPADLTALQALPEASLDSPFKTAALTLAVLCHYEISPEETWEMIDFLRGPEKLSPAQKMFLSERLSEKTYKPFSFFAGATPENGYKPTLPYTITVSDNEYSYPEENWATMYVESSGADSERQLKFRRKPSTGQWFLNDILCLSDIRIPVAEDPWA